jgi:hypothetical protein
MDSNKEEVLNKSEEQIANQPKTETESDKLTQKKVNQAKPQPKRHKIQNLKKKLAQIMRKIIRRVQLIQIIK